MIIDEQISDCEKWIAELESKTKSATVELHRMRREKHWIDWGVRPGVIAVATARYEGQRFEVTWVSARYGGGRPWVTGRLFNKDSEKSKRVLEFLDYWKLEDES